MKREYIESAFENIKYRLVSEDLQSVADILKEKTRESRDFIEVRTLVGIFEKMAKDRSDKPQEKPESKPEEKPESKLNPIAQDDK